MNPATIALAIQFIQLAIQEEPAIAAELKAILSKADPTPADWEALKQKVLGDSFESLAPDAVTQAPAAPAATA